MKVRFRVPCERCKLMLPVGSIAVRLHGRLWHPGCARDYIKARRDRHPVAV
jgi:hypothetical protein